MKLNKDSKLITSDSRIGKSIPYQFTHLFQTVTCKLKVVSIIDGIVRARVPDSVMQFPFPPAGKGKNILLFKLETVQKFLN